MAKVAQKMKQAEITEQDSLLLTRNLLRIAIFNISYIRGLFPENYFNDKEVSALDMKVKKLMPIDDDSRRLIDWMEKGVYDALQKKYLKTLLFCICESVDGPLIEEYEFSFTYSSSDNEEVSMNVNRRGNKKHGATFKSNSNEITPEQMRFSACKMVRTLIQLMRTLDQMPDERTILMKLLYYDDVTPEDYEPPFFRKSSYSESNKWTKDPLNMDVGNINSKHHALSLKVKSVLDPCEDENDNDKEDDKMSMGTALEHDSASENADDQSQENQYIVEPVGNRHQIDDNSMTDDEDTQNSEIEEENTTRIRNWILSRGVNDVSLKDIHMNFQDISQVLTEEIVGKLLKEGSISNSGRESYTINREKDIDHGTYVVKEENDMDISQKTEKMHKSDIEDYLYTNALYHTLPMDYVTVSKLQSKLEGVANQATVRKLIKKMETDGFIESKGFGKLGKPVIHNDFTNNKLLEIKKDLENKTTKANEINGQTMEFNGMALTHTPGSIPRNDSTCAALHSFGSEFTRTRVLSDRLHNTSLHNGQPSDSKSQDKANTPTSRPEPISSLESGVNGIVKTKGYDRIPREADVSVSTRSIQDKRIRKIDRVVNPILQYVKRQKNQMA